MKSDDRDGCEFITAFMGMPIVCEKCPIKGNCMYGIVDDTVFDNLDEEVDKKLADITNALVKAKKELRQPVQSMKGHECTYRDNLFCQEGECRNCEIWQAMGKK